MASTESIFDSIRIDRFNLKYEGILLGLYNDVKLGLSENKMLGVADSNILGEDYFCKNGESFGVSEWGVDGIPWGNIHGTNVWNDE